jgi:hypothetical protein
MARGWESKDIESQKEERERERAAGKGVKAEAEGRREGLAMQRSRVLRDLAVAANPRYRALLEETLRFLDGEIAKLNSK